MAKRIQFDTPEAKQFTKEFTQLCRHHSAWDIWSDYITLTACSISVMVDHDPKRFNERGQLLQEIADKYQDDEIGHFDAMNEIMMGSMTRNPKQDFLGRLYMALDFGAAWHGQYFTPVSYTHLTLPTT